MVTIQYWILVHAVIFGLASACPPVCHCFTDDAGQMTVDCHNKSLTRVPAGIPANCKLLYLGKNNLTNLPDYSFRNLTQLLYLDLSENNIFFLHIKVFIDLSNLRTLLLNKNFICYNASCVPPGVFRPLIHVTSFFIGQNANVTDIRQEYPDDAIGDMLSLQHLGIDGLKNKMFGPGFRRLKSLRVLDMSRTSQRCYVEVLSNLTLKNFRSSPLKEIHFGQCRITRIFPEAFLGLSSLEKLDLSHLADGLPFGQLEPLSYGLKDTNISYLNLNDIFKHSTPNILTKDHLKYLQSTHLKELYMDRNMIAWIEKGWLSDALPRTLEKISLNHNYLLGDPNILIAFLTYHSKLKEIQMSIIQASDGRNFILFLPLNLEIFVLTSIDTRGSSIHSIEFLTNNLTSFHVKDGSMPAFQGTLKGLKKLKTLELSNLNCFNISYNLFTFIPSLTSISLSINFLGPVLSRDQEGQLFAKQSDLCHLDLTRNSIAHLPSRFFQGLRNIQNISLSYNDIRDLNVHLDNMPFLNMLNLYSNQLLYLSSPVMAALDAIAQNRNINVDLGGNPLICDCSSYSFLTWMIRTNVHFLRQDSYSCILEGDLFYFNDLETILILLGQLCDNHYIIITLCSSCIAVCSIICIGGVLYRFRRHITYLYYAAMRQYNAQNADAKEEFAFDAFISFAESEWDVVKSRYMVNLEEIKGHRLCIHHRDFIPGTPISSNIANAIHSSKKTIVVLTRSFLESAWCKFELHMALMEHIYAGRQTLIIIKYEDIPAELMDLEILSIMRYETVLDYFPAPEHEAVFWNLLERAMCDLPI